MAEAILAKVTRFLVLSLVLAVGAAGLARAADDKQWPIDHTMGKADAPITVIEYASLDCPHCARFAADTLPKFKKDWIDTGKAKLVFRDFPLHDVALAAAMVAQCSNDHYFAYIDAFFHTQESWATAKDPLAAIKGIARVGGMSGDQVDQCFKNNELLQQIKARQEDAETTYKVDSTPTFVINGKVASGEKTYDEFVKLMPAGN